jgi:predicted N-acetyltransferase YhbS
MNTTSMSSEESEMATTNFIEHASGPLRVIIAKRKDAERIAALINSAFRGAEEFFVDGDRVDVESVLKFLGTGRFLLAESERTLLGCVYVEPRPRNDTTPERAYLGLLAVDPARQHFGLGSVLMEAAENYCRELGAGFMDILVVNLRRELFGFYRKRGYLETGTSPFPAGVVTKQRCHFIEMSKQLRPLNDDNNNDNKGKAL